MTTRPDRCSTTVGFSLIEALVSVAVLAMVVGIVLTLFSGFGKIANTESGEIEMQTAARISIDELSRLIQQTGYGIDRSDSGNPVAWQRDVVFAGPYAYAFNADIDSKVGPIASTQTLTFPGGDLYAGQIDASTTFGAETYVYTIDANGDNALTLADRTASVTGSYNPAAETPNPLDFALFRRVHGWNGSDFGGAMVPLTGLLFTNATPEVRYGDGTTPEPLFTYKLTEDLDADGSLDDSECVVAPCPPSPARAPVLYLWGDTDFDGSLSEGEKTALRTLPVGSPSWSGNILVSGGVLTASTLTAAVDPGGANASVLHVADASSFPSGAFAKLGSGLETEVFQIDGADRANNTVALMTAPVNNHAVGATLVVLPTTMLRAIRSVKADFQAISPQPDTDNGQAKAGRMGRKGTRGLDYRVMPLVASIELRNMVTSALGGGSGAATSTPSCPVTITATCDGATISQLPAYFPTNAPTQVTFLTKSASNAPMAGVPLKFTHSAGNVGALGAITGKTDGNGKFKLPYTPSGTIGLDVITATATCADGSSALQDYSTTLTIRASKVSLTLGNDCLATAKPGVAPGATYSVSIQDPSGNVTSLPVTLDLSYVTSSLPLAASYSDYEAELFVGTMSRGVTDAAGAFAQTVESTGATGVITGSVRLNKDLKADGLRLQLEATPSGAACAAAPAPIAKVVSFFDLALDSERPSPGCNEAAPCTIPSGSALPTVAARLSLNSSAVAGATVNFTKTDVHLEGTPGSSTLNPAVATSDGEGVARTTVGNSGSSTITPSSPLQTTIDASSTGGSGCVAGNIEFDGLRPQFRMEGYTGECLADMQQAWLVKNGGTTKLCTDVRNVNSSGGCALKPTGMSVIVYKPDGMTPDPNYKIDTIEGGFVATTPSCSSAAPKVTLFAKACNGNAPLLNGQRWDFRTVGTTCKLPTSDPAPGQYFVFNLITFTSVVAGTGRKVEFTMHYQCTGICPSAAFAKTFHLIAPS